MPIWCLMSLLTRPMWYHVYAEHVRATGPKLNFDCPPQSSRADLMGSHFEFAFAARLHYQDMQLS